MSESFSVKAILSAQDKNFTKTFSQAQGLMASIGASAKSGLGFGMLMGIGQEAFHVLSNGAKAVIGSVFEVGKSFDAATSQIAATMGLSKDQITDIIAEAERLGTTTKFTATEAAEGFNILAQSGLKADEQIAMMGDVLNLAAAGALSLENAASYTTATIKGYKDEAKNASYYVNMMAKGATLANTSVDMLGAAMSASAADAQSYGQKADRTALALLRLAEQNVTGTDAATALNRVMMDLYTPTSSAAEALEALGVAAYDEAGNARDLNTVIDELNAAMSGMSEEQKNAYKNTIFSTFGLKAFNKMTVTSTEKLAEFEAGLASASDGIGAAAAQAKTQLDNLEGDITIFSSATEGVKNTIFSGINEPLRSAVNIATFLATKFNGFLKDSPALSTLAKMAGQWRVNEDGALEFGGSVEAAEEKVNKLKGTLKAVAGVAAAGFMAANAGGLVGVGETLVSEFGGAAARIPGKFSVAFAKVAQASSKTTAKVRNTLVKMIPDDTLLGKAVEKAGSAFQTLGPSVQKGVNASASALTRLSGLVLNIGKVALSAIGPAAIFGAALAGMGVLYSAYGGKIDELVNLMITRGPEIINGLVSGVTGQLPALISSGAQMLAKLMEGITANIPSIFTGAVAIITGLVDGVAANINTLLPAAANMVTAIVNGIFTALPQLLVSGLNLLLSLAQGITDNLPLLIANAVSMISTLATGIINNLPTIATTAFSIIAVLISGLIENLPTLATAGWELIKSLTKGLIEAIPQVLTGAVEAIKGIFTNLWDVVTGKSQDTSSEVSTDASTMGANMQSYVGSGAAAATSSFEAMASNIMASAQTANSTVTADVAAMASGFNSTVATMQPKEIEALPANAQKAMQGFNSAISAGLRAADKTFTTTLKNIQTTANSTAIALGTAGKQGGARYADGIKNSQGPSTQAARMVVAAVVAAYMAGYAQAYASGAYVGQGFANGIASMIPAAAARAAELAAIANEAIQSRAKIGSPSKVERKDGRWWAEGYILGIYDMYKEAKDAASGLVGMPERAASSAGGLTSSAELSEEYDYSVTGETTIVVVSELDGRQVAKATYKYTRSEIQQAEERDKIRKGGTG